MNIEALLFAAVSFASVALYFPIANAAGWKQRKVLHFEDAYWNAFQCFIWSLGVILLRGSPDVDIWAILPILPTTLIYSVIAEQPGMDFDLTGNKAFNTTQIAVLTTVGALVGIFILIVLFTDSNKESLLWRLVPLFLFGIWILTWLGVNKSASGKTDISSKMISFTYLPREIYYTNNLVTTTTTDYILHFHHWMVAVAGFLVSLSPDIYSQIVSGIFWGVFCHEAAAYGIMIPSMARRTTSEQTVRINLDPETGRPLA